LSHWQAIFEEEAITIGPTTPRDKTDTMIDIHQNVMMAMAPHDHTTTGIVNRITTTENSRIPKR
jgi:ABC-type transporter lipoprotein component MlaA